MRSSITSRSLPSSGSRSVPRSAAVDLQRAADVLNATGEIIEVAELLGAGVAKTLPGKTAVADELPLVTVNSRC